MSSRIRMRRRARALAAALLTLVAAATATVLVGEPASAHDQLIGTDPADGAVVATLPGHVTLTFDAVVLASGTGDQVAVTDASGASLVAGAPQVQDNVVTQRLKGSATGTITVRWRAVSQDGHPVSGAFSFTVAGATPSPSGAATTPAASAPAAATPAPQRRTPSPSPSAAAGPATTSAPWIVLGAVTIAAMAGVGYLVASRLRRDRTLGHDAAASDAPARSRGRSDR